MGRLSIIIGLMFIAAQGFAQDQEKRNIYFGNQEFNAGNYDEAIAYYQEAIKNSPLGFKAHFNMGNAYFRKKDVKTASDIYSSILDLAPTAYDRSRVHYNLGNCQLLSNELDPAIDSYKAALRLNPNDENARYNLAYALHLRKQQPPKQDQDQQEKDKQNQDQNQENQDQQENNDQQDQNGENGDNNSSGNQNQPSDPGQEQSDAVPEKLSKEDIRKMLEAALRREKDVQKKIDEKKIVGSGMPSKKDW